jgi:ethanolamine utilization cobalamin adenosyltransferase
MANVVTELEMKKFLGMDKAILPVGSILTPAAKDWASDHKIEIVFGDGGQRGNVFTVTGEKEKAEFLRYVIESVVKKLQQNGVPVKKEELAPVVIACLERLGCQVKFLS